jgi:macrocin-O-methyltransferase TylF-like protien
VAAISETYLIHQYLIEDTDDFFVISDIKCTHICLGAIHRVKLFLKGAFLRLGYLLPPLFSEAVQKVARATALGLWLRKHRLYPPIRLGSREQIFDLIGDDVAHRRVLYLEFGVYQGDSIKYWSNLLKHPNAMLHGFDSFEGFPHAWRGDLPKGFFSTGGEVPKIADPRVKFFKGWFHETLPAYEIPPHEVMVINMDADLYSSTLFVLDRLKEAITPGTWLYFDEFSADDSEFRAFSEFVDATGMRFEAVAHCDAMLNVAFRRVVYQSKDTPLR